jgi:hypothetical protein
MLLLTLAPLASEIAPRDLTYSVNTSLTSVGHEADSPERLLRPAPATGHEPDMLDADTPAVGDNAETCRLSRPKRFGRIMGRAARAR